MTSGLSLIFLAGLLGSAHCIGMCGGFTLMIGMHTGTKWTNLVSQGSYSAGRIFTYSLLGAVAGALGQRVANATSTWANVSAGLSIIAGLFLIYQGLLATGIRFSKKPFSAIQSPCLMSPILATFLKSENQAGKFFAGVLTGFLPCGLLYAFLSLAVASRDLLWGATIMATFGAGTLPIMIATGIGGRLLNSLTRQRLLQLAAWSVVMTGAITLTRGVMFANVPSNTEIPACPFCLSLKES